MKADFFQVDAALCRKDGICAAVCPARIIRAEPGELPGMDEKLRGRCIACGQCMAFCPTKACVAPGVDGDDCRFLRPELYPAPEQVEELLFARRSIRNFKDRNVPRETLARILDAVRYAPTGHNRQTLRWVVTESREQSHALLECVINWLRALPDLDPELAAATHASGMTRAWDKGVDILSRNAPHIVIPVGPDRWFDMLDGIINLSYFEMVAQAHGVGCCWSGYLTRAFKHPAAGALRECIGLRSEEAAFSGIVAGFPKFRPASRPPRQPLRVTWL